jgi:hypothetical protein
MTSYQFEREIRTPNSETFVIESNGDEIGRIDLHYSNSTCYGTLCVPDNFDDEAIEALIGEIDERLVMSWDPLRDDFIVTVWSGHEVGIFSESGDDDDDDDDDDSDDDYESPNGKR